jgi:hypothetical protein
MIEAVICPLELRHNHRVLATYPLPRRRLRTMHAHTKNEPSARTDTPSTSLQTFGSHFSFAWPWRTGFGITPAFLCLCAGFTFLLSASMPTDASAHSWYPHECCDDRDCAPVEEIHRLSDHSEVVVVSGLQIFVPVDFPRRPSPDSKIHVCFDFDGDSQIYRARCYFVPPTS